MKKQFHVPCSGCHAPVHFTISVIPVLDTFIEEEIDDARSDVRSEYEVEEDGDLDIETFLADRRLVELSAAIRRGDRLEAELLVDKIASLIGARAEEQVAQGRYVVARAA